MSTSPTPARIASVDAYRGFVMFLMLVGCALHFFLGSEDIANVDAKSHHADQDDGQHRGQNQDRAAPSFSANLQPSAIGASNTRSELHTHTSGGKPS